MRVDTIFWWNFPVTRTELTVATEEFLNFLQTLIFGKSFSSDLKLLQSVSPINVVDFQFLGVLRFAVSLWDPVVVTAWVSEAPTLTFIHPRAL